MKKYFLLISLIVSITFFGVAYSDDEHSDEKEHAEENDHSHDEAKKESGEGGDQHKHEEKGHSEHAEKDGHGDEHAEGEGEEEENPSIGPDKGILEKSKLGFKLAPEAVKTFDLKFAPLTSGASDIPREAVVTIRDGKFIYKFRDDWISKVPIKVLSKNNSVAKISVEGIEAGDQLIIHGVGFVRGAELIVEEGATQGHSH